MGKGGGGFEGFKPPFEVKNLRKNRRGGFFLFRHVVAKKFCEKTPPRFLAFFLTYKNLPFLAKKPPLGQNRAHVWVWVWVFLKSGYGYGYGYLGMKKPGIPKMGMGMGIPEPGILYAYWHAVDE